MVQLEYRAKLMVTLNREVEDSLLITVQKNTVIGECCDNVLNIQTLLRFCTDITCTDYIEDTNVNVVRKESFIVEHSITTVEFQGYYLKFLKAELGEFVPNVLSKDSSMPGRVILELSSNIAKPNLVLKVISQLFKTEPSGHRVLQEVILFGKRFLQKEARDVGDDYKVAGVEEISIWLENSAFAKEIA